MSETRPVEPVMPRQGVPRPPPDEVAVPSPLEPRPPGRLGPQDEAEIAQLRRRDAEVREHEQSFRAAAGPYLRGGARYEYRVGPDGRRYAVAGEVAVDAAPVPGAPEATIRKARILQRAVAAVAKPSARDKRIAAAAARMEYQARLELEARRRREDEEALRG